jgi:DNA modification methylase
MAKLKQHQATQEIISHFDYAILETDQCAIVKQKTLEIRERLKRSAQDIWEIGQRLYDVRNTLKHGQFDSWLKAEFGWSRRTAYNFINVYESFSNRANLAEVNIATSALYLLAAPSTPETVRQSVMDEAKKVGGKVAHKDIADRLRPNRQIPTTPITLGVAATTVASESPATVVAKRETAKQEIIRVLANPKQFTNLKPDRWYQLGDRHHLFTGDTRLPDFAANLPEIRLAIAITSDEWDHDWLVDIADSLVVLQPDMVQTGTIEQLILMFTKPNDFVLFPWLPMADMIALGDRLGRRVYAGDADGDRVQAAAQTAGLAAKLA